MFNKINYKLNYIDILKQNMSNPININNKKYGIDTIYSSSAPNMSDTKPSNPDKPSDILSNNLVISDLNYSIFIDSTESLNSLSNDFNTDVSNNTNNLTNKLINSNLKINLKWVDSNLINNCQLCSCQFGFLWRKHHCRICGGVFCSNCCNKYIDIPTHLLDIPKHEDKYKVILSNTYRWLFNGDKQLVCNNCHNKVNELLKVEHLIKILYYLTLKELYTVSQTSKDYYNASLYYINKFRNIQYFDFDHKYTIWEINIIYTIKDYLLNHSVWFSILIKTIFCYTNLTKKIDRIVWLNNILINIDDIKINSSVKCWSLLCSRKCSKKLDFDDIIDILKYISENYVFFDDCNEYVKNIILILVEYLIKRGVRNKHTFIPVLSKIFIDLFNNDFVNIDEKFMKKLFLSLFNNVVPDDNVKTAILLVYEKYYIEDTIMNNHLINNFNVDVGIKFYLKYLTEILITKFSTSILHDVTKMIMTINNIYIDKLESFNTPFIYPFDPSYTVLKILSRNVINSITKPIVVEVELYSQNINKTIIKKFIIKKDTTLRKEQIISCLIDVIHHKLSSYKYIDDIGFENIDTYQIIMLSKDIAVIEFIENSVTLKHINDEGFTLQNYILNKNKDYTLNNIKTRFYQSLAIASAISYIIGLGDRHLDNIMINNKGQIFHVDYGYIMENPKTNIFDMPHIKVTNDIIDFLGGVNSNYYHDFKKYLVKVYNVIRVNKIILFTYFKFICDEGFLKWDIIKDKLEIKMLNGLKYKDIELTLINEFETANNYSSMFGDLCHSYKQKYL